jgi:hypothetical protein
MSQDSVTHARTATFTIQWPADTACVERGDADADALADEVLDLQSRRVE